jgi:hypothetical protein
MKKGRAVSYLDPYVTGRLYGIFGNAQRTNKERLADTLQ